MRLFFSTLQLYLLFILSLLIFSFGNPHLVLAQPPDTVGVSISPTLIEEKQIPGSTRRYSITLKNLTQVEQTYTISTKNVDRMDSLGNPIFSEEDSNGFGITNWIKLQRNQITVPAKQTEVIEFTINVPTSTTAGSYVGSVFINVQPPEIETSGVAVGYSVGNIVHIIVEGEMFTNASVTRFLTDRYVYGSSNASFSIQVENTGTVLVRPQGLLQIRDMLGRTVDTLPINEEQAGVLPENIRIFKTDWQRQQIGFGRYEASLTLSYIDWGTTKTLSNTTAFWVVPPYLLLTTLSGLVAFMLILFALFKVGGRTSFYADAFRQQRATRRRKKRVLRVIILLSLIGIVSLLYIIVLLLIFS